VFIVHVPKTAGTTIATAMRLRHGDAWAWVGQGIDSAGEQACRQALADIESADPPVRVIQGHVPLSLEPLRDSELPLATFLRDPLERTASAYFYRFRKKGWTRPAPISRPWLEVFGIHDNLQTRMLSGMPLDEPASGEMLDAAIRNLEQRFRFVGTTERFDESYVLLHVAFGWRPLLIANRRVNATRPRVDELTEEEHSVLRQHNELDSELHAVAQRRLDQAISRSANELQVELAAYELARRLSTTERAHDPDRLGLDPDQADDDTGPLVRSRAETILVDTALATATGINVGRAGTVLADMGEVAQRAADRLAETQRLMARLQHLDEKLRRALVGVERAESGPAADDEIGEPSPWSALTRSGTGPE
jgi:hypothetical protein